MQAIQGLSVSILENERIISIIRSFVYKYCTMLISLLMFSSNSKDIFHKYSSIIDQKIGNLAGDAFSKMPEAFERLDSGSVESISHAMTSCRRIIDGFADAIFPAQDTPVIIRGESVVVTEVKPKNRIIAFIFERTNKSRYDRIRRSLFDLYERVSAGVHADISFGEAKALVLQTYLLLGEIAELEVLNDQNR
jgi:hypothetical protein